jgi:biotin-dependent carboxylase-like uncharacterized protein
VTGLEVVEAGQATTVQDLGRPGFGAYGVPEGGAMDRRLLGTANRLSGNPGSAAGLEFVVQGPTLRWTGRRRLHCVVAGDSIWSVTLAQGDELAVAPLRGRAYGYVAVNGGLDVPTVMGARGTCLPGGFGGFQGRELRRGDLLPVGPGTAARGSNTKREVVTSAEGSEVAASASPQGSYGAGDGGGDVVTLRVHPRDGRHTRAAFRSLLAAAWLAGDGNRVGIRLTGPALHQRQLHLSEPLPPGAVQVSGGGQPILLLRDHPTIGGYPVVAVVLRENLDAAARLRPGTPLRFVSA